MLRGGPQISAQDIQAKQQQQQQKQKKRLSFKDPEVEGPQQSQYYSGGRPKQQPSRLLDARGGSFSVENLSLEDQALQVVQSVGSAFSDLSLQGSIHSDYLDTADSSVGIQDSYVEAYSNDCFLSDNASYQRNLQLQNFRISAEDQEFLDDLSPPLHTSNMRCPPIETSEPNPYHNSIPPMELTEEKYPSSAQHQIQLLKYQLDQQSQQTQLALHQVQFLSDQMETECAARRKAQEQNNQLMNQNKDLLNHIEKLFQQIEELEKQIQVLEHEKRSRVSHHQESQMVQSRTPLSYAGNRRLSSDSLSDKPTPMSRGMQPTSQRSSLTSAKQNAAQQHKLTMNQRQPNATPNRKNPATSPRPLPTLQNRTVDPNNKAKETLHIGDASPPVQSSTFSPFGAGWKTKPPEVHPMEADKAATASGRTRTGSFSSFSSRLKPPENIASKNTLFSSNSSISSISGITNKKYSSSTSDLYNSTGAFQSTKPLVMEDTSSGNKSNISNLNLNAPSKLPRFQPYTGRRSSLTKDADQFNAIGKDKFKTTPQTSLYNR